MYPLSPPSFLRLLDDAIISPFCFSFSTQWGLNCFQPSEDEAVPGCPNPSNRKTCIQPDPGTLVLMGENWDPAENFPLGECEGDCDYDDDCDVRKCERIQREFFYITFYPTYLVTTPCVAKQWGLNCYQREGTDDLVPGCSGTGFNVKDYCYEPPTGVLVLMGDNGDPAANFPLQPCQGDCDSDIECAVCVLSYVLDIISPPLRRCDHLTFLLLFLHFQGISYLFSTRFY
jgi:hypothetical protein